MKASDWIALSTLVLGSGGFFSGVYLWWSGSIKKSYAAERDFNHIRRNQEQTNQGLVHLDDKISESTERILEKITSKLDRSHEELGELKALLLAHLGIDISSRK